jgi:hypothetical protein
VWHQDSLIPGVQVNFVTLASRFQSTEVLPEDHSNQDHQEACRLVLAEDMAFYWERSFSFIYFNFYLFLPSLVPVSLSPCSSFHHHRLHKLLTPKSLLQKLGGSYVEKVERGMYYSFPGEWIHHGIGADNRKIVFWYSWDGEVSILILSVFFFSSKLSISPNPFPLNRSIRISGLINNRISSGTPPTPWCGLPRRSWSLRQT